MTPWKQPPADKSKRWLNPSLELQILLACNWSCTACDQLSNWHGISFVKRGTMSTSQIVHFVQELRSWKGYFGRIRILGGEPTLHPKFQEIVSILFHDLVNTGHVGQLELITNGSHPERIEPVRHMMNKVRVSGEAAKERDHVANLVYTPQELGYAGKRCSQPEHCGWSLSYYGFAPCSSGAGIMRLRNLMDMAKLSLPGPGSTEEHWPQLQSLCDLCYHGLKDEDKVKCGIGRTAESRQMNRPSADSWGYLSEWLTGRVDDWPVYGDEQHVADSV